MPNTHHSLPYALYRTNAYQRVSSSAAFIEAQSQARAIESEAYDRATSKVRSEIPMPTTSVSHNVMRRTNTTNCVSRQLMLQSLLRL